jgi:hypothetical protein
MAFFRFLVDKKEIAAKEYVGYSTKAGSPVYLLNASAYPFSQAEGGWNTFHYLPEPLVPEDDVGIVVSMSLLWLFFALIAQTHFHA